MTGYGKAALVLALGLVAAGPARAMEPLVGQWEKKIGKTRTVTLTFDNGRMHLSVAGAESFKIHSDCQATRDGVVYGIVTSAEVDATDSNMENEDKEIAELVDQPFSFRYRVDEGRLFIWGVKSSSKVLEDGVVQGGFKSAQSATPRTPACCYPPAPVYCPPANPVVPAVSSYKTKARR